MRPASTTTWGVAALALLLSFAIAEQVLHHRGGEARHRQLTAERFRELHHFRAEDGLPYEVPKLGALDPVDGRGAVYTGASAPRALNRTVPVFPIWFALWNLTGFAAARSAAGPCANKTQDFSKYYPGYVTTQLSWSEEVC